MRTTLKLDDDVVAAADKLRRDEGIGLSEAVNRLARAGMMKPVRRTRYRHRTSQIGLRVDVSNIGTVLELLDET
jgi:hypothetical protein